MDRLDGSAIGAATGGVAGAILSGAGVLIARGVSKQEYGRGLQDGLGRVLLTIRPLGNGILSRRS